MLCLLQAHYAFAAGPKAGDFYIGFAAGIFTPDFSIPKNGLPSVTGPPETNYIVIPIGGFPIAIGLSGGVPGATGEDSIRPENYDILAFGGNFGYKITDTIGIQMDFDVSFPDIQIQDVGVGNVIGVNGRLGQVQIMQPGILPITASVIYTFMPESLFSPYVGIGLMVTTFSSRGVEANSDEVLTLDGGVEYGYLLHTGVMLDVSDDWYAFADIRYGRIDSPDIKDRFGDKVPLDTFEYRQFKFGVGYRF
jgi:outer membrane protein